MTMPLYMHGTNVVFDIGTYHTNFGLLWSMILIVALSKSLVTYLITCTMCMYLVYFTEILLKIIATFSFFMSNTLSFLCGFMLQYIYKISATTDKRGTD